MDADKKGWSKLIYDEDNGIDWYLLDNKEIVDNIKRYADGIKVFENNSDSGYSYAVFSPEQIKSADPVTYDDNGNIIPLSQRFDTENKDIRYSIKSKTQYLPKKSLELGLSSHIMSLHAGVNFDKPEYGLHTYYGDHEYLYDYFGDGEFGVISKYPLNRIDEVIENGTRNKRDTDWYDDKWESYRRRIKSNSRFISSQGNSVSVNGLGNDPMEENQNDKSEENNQEGDISPEEDTYFKTGADGTNRPRYEKRYSLRNPNGTKKTNQELWHEQQAEFAKKIEQKRQRDMADNSKGIRARAADYLDRKEYQFADRGFYLKQWQTEIEESLADDPNLADILFYNGMRIAHRQTHRFAVLVYYFGIVF